MRCGREGLIEGIIQGGWEIGGKGEGRRIFLYVEGRVKRDDIT